MKITMAQQNYTVGDFQGNTDKIIQAVKANLDSDFIVFSELSISGYYPWDLMYRDNFITEQDKALAQIIEFSTQSKAFIVVGLVRENTIRKGKPFFNSLVVISNGRIVFDYDKQLLPTYNIFDEQRHFQPGVKNGVSLFGKDRTKVGFFICEDGWSDEEHIYTTNPIHKLYEDKADIIIGLNASPANINKANKRESLFSYLAHRYSTPIVYVNQVGSNDEIVFDGGSFVFDKFGNKQVQLKYYAEDYYTFDTTTKESHIVPAMDKYEMIFNHISLGLKDYLSKQGFKKVIVGSSGGIDSALTLAIAAITLGSDNVEAITMPSKWSSSGSVNDSEALCNNLGIKLYNMPIVNEMNAISSDYFNSIQNNLTGIAAENLQARIRGTILMAHSNQTGSLLLTTGNKSEISVGYFTLYGDSNGGLNLIGDLYKTEVYALSQWINNKFGGFFGDSGGELIPSNIILKEPSAELSPDQKDSDSLPDYEHLDAILKREIEWEYLTKKEQQEVSILIDSVDNDTVLKVLKLIDKAEFKRKQSAPIIRVHSRAFGSGRRIPTVHKMPISI